MHSTRPADVHAKYIGVDLTDRHAAEPKAIDVCGLIPTSDGGFSPTFWTWEWDPPGEPIDVTPLTDEIRGCKLTMLDAPQGLALPGNGMRECERLLGAAGKSPDVLPPRGRPFAGFVRSSVELFQALWCSGTWADLPAFSSQLGEVYPGGVWRKLAGRPLPKKITIEGRCPRKLILKNLGVRFSDEFLPSHDQNDACLAAVTAAAAMEPVPHAQVDFIGHQLQLDANGILREGQIAVLRWRNDVHAPGVPGIENVVPPHAPVQAAQDQPGEPRSLSRPNLLLGLLVLGAKHGYPAICTYKFAYEFIFLRDWKGLGHSQQAVRAAKATTEVELEGLGYVKLDAFIVNSETGRPGAGHWEAAGYTDEEWDRVLGGAFVLQNADDLRNWLMAPS